MNALHWLDSEFHKAQRGGGRGVLPVTGPVVSSLQIIVPYPPERIWLGAQSPPLIPSFQRCLVTVVKDCGNVSKTCVNIQSRNKHKKSQSLEENTEKCTCVYLPRKTSIKTLRVCCKQRCLRLQTTSSVKTCSTRGRCQKSVTWSINYSFITDVTFSTDM